MKEKPLNCSLFLALYFLFYDEQNGYGEALFTIFAIINSNQGNFMFFHAFLCIADVQNFLCH